VVKKIGHVTILVKDQDEAARFYIEKLGFIKRQDTFFGPGMRWVTVSPRDQKDLELTFVKAENEEYLKTVGRQAAGHVLLTLETDNCQRDYQNMRSKGVKFHGEPTHQIYGVEVVLEDVYGNLLDLIEREKS
jgi:catechol 2,3-dioxygenase-like lactoylglutathione lyase family enzyme